jgi:drug/metabolite transporter (DMT)-like permease
MSGAQTTTTGKAYLYLTLTMFCWSIGVVVGRGVHESVPPIGLTFWRWFGGALILLPFVWRELRRTWPVVKARIGLFFALGGIIILSSAGLLLSVQYTTAINATLVNATQPVITVLGAWIIGQGKLKPVQLLGIAAAAVGILIMASQGDWEVLAHFRFNGGDIIIFVATFGYAAYALGTPRLPHEMGLFTSLFVICVTGSLLLLPLYVWESVTIRPVPLTLEGIGACATLAISMTVISVYWWNLGNRTVGPARAGIFVNFFPVFSALLAIVFLDERLHPYHIAGAVFVCAGISLVVLSGRALKER